MAAATVTLPTWARALAIVVGLVAIAAGIIVLVFPGIAVLTLVFLLGIALLFIGIDRLMSGITGHPYQGMFGMPLAPPAQPPASGGSPPK